MTTEQASQIKSGSEIVKDFVDKLKTNSALDSATVTAISELYHSGKLTKNKLLQLLEQCRATAIETQQNS